MSQQKAWTPRDLWAILEHASVQEKAWIGLALCGAMDNADIAHLTFSLFDEAGMLLDYRRRKTGLQPRLIPLHSVARQWLDDYLVVRPKPADPADKDLVFLTPGGRPLQRMLPGKSGVGHQVDYLRDTWVQLLRRAGLRRKPEFHSVCVVCGKERPAPRAQCCGQGRWRRKKTTAAVGGPDYKGFRSLRTTFANLVPRGYSDERKLIMGHAGDITLNHYIERFGVEHLRKLVEEVWLAAFTAPWPSSPLKNAYRAIFTPFFEHSDSFFTGLLEVRNRKNPSKN
jgi:integrase